MHSLTDIPQTFKHIAFKVLDTLQNKTNVVFSTDMYLPGSIKSHELLRRVCSEKLILEGVNQRKPADFKVFLQNNENKQQLFRLMYRVWQSNEASKRIAGKNRIFIVDGIAHQLTSDGISVNEQQIPEIDSTHEETDNRQILYLFYAKDKGYKYGVIRSPDSNLFFLSLYYAHRLKPLIVLLDIGSGDHRKLLNISDIADDFGGRLLLHPSWIICVHRRGYYVCFQREGKGEPFKKTT